ncbi:hypothetical protein ACO2Q9_03815 [Variovorax sp. VNK109]|uniref:hypothetical protein n=1 Tax=Variovorax sp. VNK109 TaxID=3400919 RepID=UPI003C12476F
MRKIAFLLLLMPFGASGATVYLCKAYSGGTFWTNTHCSQRNATVERIVTVPDDMTWEQQVDIARAQHQQGQALQSQAVPQVSTAQRCAQLQAERQRIWSRYSNWQYQPPEVIGPDRQRTLAIQAEQQTLRCPMQ